MRLDRWTLWSAPLNDGRSVHNEAGYCVKSLLCLASHPELRDQPYDAYFHKIWLKLREAYNSLWYNELTKLENRMWQGEDVRADFIQLCEKEFNCD